MPNTSPHKPPTSTMLIGFDVRRSPKATSNQLLGPERRSGCLLVPDCTPVLSADRSLWPSVFYMKSQYENALVKFSDDILLPESPKNRYFEAFDLWDNVYAMREAYVLTTTGDCGVAFGLIDPECYKSGFQSDSWFDAIYFDPGVTPPQAGIDWAFLGFDVVNSGFMSALSGFGPLEDIEGLRKLWAADMNPFCLFSDRDRSISFCEDANKRLVGDGPFFSLAIFLLWDTSGEVKAKATRLHEP